MNLNHLTDNELITHTIMHDTDPVRVRLATIMDNMPGFILQRLEDVGMDRDTCLFDNLYDPGDWIQHLESEIDFYERELTEANEKLAALQTKTVLEMMLELGQSIQALEVQLSNAQHDAKDAKSKLSMWSKLNGNV